MIFNIIFAVFFLVQQYGIILYKVYKYNRTNDRMQVTLK